jgi:site-specific DNA recombinase
MMTLFGGLSKAERSRLRLRTRAAMHTHGNVGGWLGGRPNFGYRLIDTGVLHPRAAEAARGVHLRTLEPDPDVALVVARIFEMFDAGLGYKSIARRLEAEGIRVPRGRTPSPPTLSRGVGKLRGADNPHQPALPRTSSCWTPTAV